MTFAKERITVICEQLKKMSFAQKMPLTQWEIKKGNFVYPKDAEAAPESWQEFDSLKMHWYGPDEHYWFKTKLTVPESFDGKPLWMIIHTQIDEWDDGKNPQFLLFVDDEIVQGIDMNHREVLITPKAQAGKEYKIDLQAYTGTLHSEFRLIGEIAEIDPAVNALYYDLQVPLWGTDRMNKEEKVCIDIITVLNDTINFLDLRNPHSVEFYESVNKASEYLKKALYEEMAGYEDIIASCIGHTHIDVAWWWTVAQTREKVARSFATVLKLMDEYPDYKFMSSQPQLYVFLKERYPELYARVKQRIEEGRWEPEGGMWLEADCNLTSGESLVRQFVHGKRFFKEEFGIDNKILWLPDVFGYSAALPQILKKSGIDYFMTTKLSWNQFNKIPSDTFLWQGIDGTKVFTHMISTLGVGQNVKNFFTTYNGMLHPDAIMGGWERYSDKNINNDILIAYGYGDGGGGPTRQMLETSQRMEKGVKGIPKVRQVFSKQYFDELKDRVEENRELSTWVGELYFEYHRGTYTSMARNKRSNRKSEIMMMDLELLSVLALMQKEVKYPTEEIDKMWKTILLNQFHDILPGSSIKEVYEVTKKEYEEIAQQGEILVKDRISTLSDKGDAITVYNTLGFERDDIVNLGNIDESITAIEDVKGNIYPVQHEENGALAYVSGVPSKGFKSFKKSELKKESAFNITKSGIETPFYKVDIDENGLFTSLFDKKNKREVFKSGEKGNLMRVYEDKPIYYDNWDIDIFYTEKHWDVTNTSKLEWTENGSVFAALEIERKFSNSVIKQKIYFYKDSPRIDFETYVDWKENQHLLKVLFPLDLNTDEASFDIQFGNTKRKTHENTSWDKARFETCAHKWIDISEGGYGVSLLNDCKYGHSVKEGNAAITLIKSGIEPNPTTDQEEHFFTYAVYPHANSWQEAGTAKQAYMLNQKALCAVDTEFKDSFSFAEIDNESVMLETVKQAENGEAVILRMYEYKNSRGEIIVKMPTGFKAVYECDLLENEEGEALAENANSFTSKILPFEIKTFKVVF